MKTTSIVMMVMGTAAVIFGLVPWLGFLNGLSIFLSGAAAVLGLIGVHRAAAHDDRKSDVRVYLFVMVVGVIMTSLGSLRCVINMNLL